MLCYSVASSYLQCPNLFVPDQFVYDRTADPKHFLKLSYSYKIGIPNLTIRYKSLFDEAEPESSWKIADDESLRYMNLSEIEWYKIDDVTREYSRKGLLLDPEVTEEIKMSQEFI